MADELVYTSYRREVLDVKIGSYGYKSTSPVQSSSVDDAYYVRLAGRTGGQTVYGGIGPLDSLTFIPTSNTASSDSTGEACINFKTGVNGSITAMYIDNIGNIYLPVGYINFANGFYIETTSESTGAFYLQGNDGVLLYYESNIFSLGNAAINVYVPGKFSVGTPVIPVSITAYIYRAVTTDTTYAALQLTTNRSSVNYTAILGCYASDYSEVAAYQSTCVLQTYSTHIALSAYGTNDKIYFYAGNRTAAKMIINNDSNIFVSTNLGTSSYVSGFSGSGWQLTNANDTNYNLTVDNLTVRKSMSVYELIINQVRATNGAVWVSDSAKIKEVVHDSDEVSHVCYIDTDDNNISQPFVVNDILLCQKWTGRNIKYYIGVVSSVSAGGDYFTVVVSTSYEAVPEENDDLVRIGNVNNTSRQGSIYITASDTNAPYIDILDGVTSDSLANKTKVRLGKLTGITDTVFGSLSGYGLFSSNVYLTGGINATSGLIGGWSITNEYLRKDTGTDATSAGLAPTDYPFYAGATYANRASAPFRVTPAGVITAESGTIGGFTINATAGLYSGTGATRVQMKPGAGFWAGATAIGDAPFSVNQAGDLNLGTSTGSKLTYVASTGVLTFKTKNANQRIEINGTDNNFIFYNSAGQEVLRIDDDVDSAETESSSVGLGGVKVKLPGTNYVSYFTANGVFNNYGGLSFLSAVFGITTNACIVGLLNERNDDEYGYSAAIVGIDQTDSGDGDSTSLAAYFSGNVLTGGTNIANGYAINANKVHSVANNASVDLSSSYNVFIGDLKTTGRTWYLPNPADYEKYEMIYLINWNSNSATIKQLDGDTINGYDNTEHYIVFTHYSHNAILMSNGINGWYVISTNGSF